MAVRVPGLALAFILLCFATTWTSGGAQPCEDSCVNGQCESSGICECFDYWYGTNCSQFACELGVNPCLNDGVCVNSPTNDSFTCDCPDDYGGPLCAYYQGEGAIVLCESSVDHEGNRKCDEDGGVCVVEEGVETCLCNAGFNGTMCEDEYDPCTSRGCHNGGICSNENFLTCDCPYGYNPNSDCKHPYVEFQLCKFDPCQNNGTCDYPVPIPFDGLPYVCYCTRGFTGTNCTTRICDELQCLNGGVCEIDHCECPLGWKGEDCSIFDDPCPEVVCKNGGNCTYIYNTSSTSCACPSTFTGDDCGDDVDECAMGNVCKNGGECINMHGGYLCLCPTGYTGPTCEDLVDHCESNPCQNDGVCENKPDGYVCKCGGAHVGLLCEILWEDTCASEEKECYFGGLCVEDPLLNRHVCNCSQGYMGEFCLYQYQPCVEAGCSLAGTSKCTFEAGLHSCQCKEGFTGSSCGTKTVCASSPCENGGTCHEDGSGGYSCDCPPGYTDDRCQSLIYSECAGQSLDCINGTCFQLLGEEFCKCAAGWGGKDCSIDVNECSQFPCQNGGTCSNTLGGYTCNCPTGYDGEDCSLLAGSCNPNPCQNGGSCVPGPSPVCSCQPGYTGPLCETDDCTNELCASLAGNKNCDLECFTAACGFDGGRDCFTPSSGRDDPWVSCPNRDYCVGRYNNGYCDQECNNARCLYDGNDCLPATETCSDEIVDFCNNSSGNGVCDKKCNNAECYMYDSDCAGHNQVYLPNYLVMVLASMDENAFEDEAVEEFLADLGDIIHAEAVLVDAVELSQRDVESLNGVTYNSDYYYWRVTLKINIQYCEASCPTSIDQVLGSINAAYSSGRTSVAGFEVVDAYEEEPSTLDTQAIAFYSLLAVSLVLVVVVVGIIGKRVRDNGGVKAVVKKIRVRSTWQVPGGATPEPISSPLTRGQSLTSDGRSSSIEPILDPSTKKDGFPHCTLSRIEVPVHPGGASEGTCVWGESRKDSRTWTSLHREAAHQPSDALKRIITSGMARNGSVVDINSQGPGGFTPLMVAIVAEKGPWRIRSYSGHAVRSDSSSGSEHSEHDFLLSSSSHSSPHLAMRRMPGKREMPESRVGALITQETDVNLVNDQGQTALHLAVLHSRGDYVQVLLAAKADPNVQDMWGQSPLHVAIGAAAEGAFKVLLDHSKTNIELKSQGGITPLMMAVMMVNQYMVKVLVQRNADIAATDSEGRTAVHWAAMLNNIEALKLLVRQGPDNVKDASNSKGETALFLACREGCTESVRHLLDCFANTTLLDNLERSPMQIAHEKQNHDIVEMLQQTSQGHIVPPPPYMKHMPSHSATSSGMFVRMPSGIKMEPGLQATSMHPTVSYPSSQHQGIYHPPQENVPLTFGDFSMGRQSSVERALDYLVESTLLNSQPHADHSPSLRLTHPSDSPPYMATGSYADPSNQPQSSASMMHGNGVTQDMNHSSPSHPVISPGMQPGASMGVSYSSTGSYDPVSTTSGVFASPSEMESMTTFSPSTVSASNQPITTHHTINNVGSKPLQHLPYHGAYSVAPTMPATSINPMATSEGQYLSSISSGHTVASSVEQSVQQSQGYDNANMHPSLSPLSAQTVSPNAQALHMPQAQHSGFSPNTAPPLSAGENKSPYSYGFPSPPKGPDDYSYSGASYQAVVGDVNSLTPSPEDYSNCTATEHSPMRPQATVIHAHYAAQEQMYPGVQLYHDYTLQSHAQLQGAMNSSLKESTV